jgi:DtxR family transcriptional regulator, Mn-dependent transcriptional regulator
MLMSATPVVESYLEMIYNMTMEGDVVIGARLAERFRISPPTVTETLKRMTRDGYVEMDARRQVTLTEKGLQIAEEVLRRHRLTERFLVDMLGMPWHEVHEEATRLEHYISGAVAERVSQTLKAPTTCPHGNPIPGYVPDARNYLKEKGAVRLLLTEPGSRWRILLISEVVEDEEELISYLHERGLTPGTEVSLNSAPGSTLPDEELVDVSARGGVISLPARVAYALWVAPLTSRE